jgi:hypothetical protein
MDGWMDGWAGMVYVLLLSLMMDGGIAIES